MVGVEQCRSLKKESTTISDLSIDKSKDSPNTWVLSAVSQEKETEHNFWVSEEEEAKPSGMFSSFSQIA